MGPVGDFLECYVSFRVCNTGTPLLLFSRHVLLLPVPEVLFSTTKAHWFKPITGLPIDSIECPNKSRYRFLYKIIFHLFKQKKHDRSDRSWGVRKKISKIVRTQRLTKDHPSPPITTHHPTLSNGMIQSGQCIYIYRYFYINPYPESFGHFEAQISLTFHHHHLRWCLLETAVGFGSSQVLPRPPTSTKTRSVAVRSHLNGLNAAHSYWTHGSGQIIIFHQPRFPWNKGISLSQLPFGVRSCEVAKIWPDVFFMERHLASSESQGQPPNHRLDGHQNSRNKSW